MKAFRYILMLILTCVALDGRARQIITDEMPDGSAGSSFVGRFDRSTDFETGEPICADGIVVLKIVETDGKKQLLYAVADYATKEVKYSLMSPECFATTGNIDERTGGLSSLNLMEVAIPVAKTYEVVSVKDVYGADDKPVGVRLTQYDASGKERYALFIKASAEDYPLLEGNPIPFWGAVLFDAESQGIIKKIEKRTNK